ncbi:glycosyltransferase [Pedobacter sp.]|jgi:hypothetical protein|uniref:glycosyltransferase n=1 Tax=Pedobacter sp. TaxID=1411316 RepID=UPI002BC0A73E|nr:glycosyltransferase [Pedobacter sp.]HWW43345.1 glycosyltransferase [Pedobacter sp.]
MSLKKIGRWIDVQNHSTGFEIVQKYYSKKEEGQSVHLFSPAFLLLYMKRLCLIFLHLFRNKTTSKNLTSPSMKAFLLRLLGFYALGDARSDLQKEYRPLAFPSFSNPLVSIIISSSGDSTYTYNILRTILKNTTGISYEIILLSDGSTKQNDDFFTSTPIIHIHDFEKKGSTFLKNHAAGISRGEFLCFLDNNILVGEKWLENLLNVFKYDSRAGVAGPKLVYPYGLLKAAGSFIDPAGERIYRGQYKDAEDFKYNYLSETGCCSSTCLLVKKDVFEEAGKFDTLFSTRDYTDASFCCSVKTKANRSIYYQPLSKIIHFEGFSSGAIEQKPSDNKSEQQLFTAKWANELKQFHESTTTTKRPASILIIDATFPKPDQDSGSKRLFEILKIFKSLHLDVYFMAHQETKVDPYYSNLVNMGIKVICPQYPKEKLTRKLPDLLGSIDMTWISRPDINKIYGPAIQALKPMPWLYDTVDLHFIRLQRAFELSGMDPAKIEEKINPIRELELSLAKQASCTITVTDVEKQILHANGIKNVAVIPNVHEIHLNHPDNPGFNERKDLVFIGSYAHEPNIDAALWLANEIMPLVWDTNPHIKLILLGSKPSPEVLALKCDRIDVPGFIHDVEPYFINSRVFVAPLRYGAGMKGKIGQSLEYGLPIVSTNIGIEGMGLTDRKDVLVGETTAEFASKIIELYESQELWHSIQRNSIHALEEYTPENVTKKLNTLLNNLALDKQILD